MDSGASYHTVALEDLTEREYQTIRSLEKPITMETANGEIVADSEADIVIHYLDITVTAVVVPSPTPPLLSVGMLATQSSVKFAWDGDGPTLTKPDGTIIRCDMGVNVPLISAANAPTNVNEEGLPGIVSVETTDGPSTTTLGDSSASGDSPDITKVSDLSSGTLKRGSKQDDSDNAESTTRKRDLSDLPRPDVPLDGASKRRRRAPKMKWGRASTDCKHNVFTHFPKDPDCPICQKSKTMKARCSRKTGESKPDSLPKPTAFGQFVSADHAIFNEGNESRLHDTVALIVQDSLLTGFRLILRDRRPPTSATTPSAGSCLLDKMQDMFGPMEAKSLMLPSKGFSGPTIRRLQTGQRRMVLSNGRYRGSRRAHRRV